jgi:hypothetical protein
MWGGGRGGKLVSVIMPPPSWACPPSLPLSSCGPGCTAYFLLPILGPHKKGPLLRKQESQDVTVVRSQDHEVNLLPIPGICLHSDGTRAMNGEPIEHLMLSFTSCTWINC